MTIASWIVVVSLIVIGCMAMWIYRGTVMKAPIPIATLVAVILVAFVGYNHNRSENQQKIRDQCVERVGRSLANRTMWVDLGSYLAEQGFDKSAQWVQVTLDRDLPILSVDDCPKA